MTRADLLTDLAKFGMIGDKNRVRKVVEAIIAEERAKKHSVLANTLDDLINTIPSEKLMMNSNVMLDQRITNFVHEVMPDRTFNDLILPKQVREISNEVVMEHHRIDLLRSYNLEPRNRILLIGPPGNGKTSLAEAFAQALMIPFLIVRYEGVVGAYLGETAIRLRRLIEYASTRKCVLFFDEFETLGKERGDRHETGEIKRVVSSLLMQIDSLPSHVVVIGATNHPELLDRAVWRRFQVRMTLPEPTASRLAEWFAKFEQRIHIPFGYTPETLAKKLYGVNFAEAEEFGSSVFRQYVLDQPDSDMKKIVDRTIKNWAARSVKTKQQNGGDE
jgi:SpoVK/Ycf46/Vps4 family AAA+-type ATPase